MIQKKDKSIESNGNINYNNYRIEIGRLEDGKYLKIIIYVNLGGEENGRSSDILSRVGIQDDKRGVC